MRNYTVKYDKKVIMQIQKMDKSVALLIKRWIEKNIVNTDNPRLHGKSLVGNFSNYWRYRIGDYRLICEINDNELIIIALSAGHRREIYSKN